MINSERVTGAGLLSGFSHGVDNYISEDFVNYAPLAIKIATEQSDAGYIANTSNLNGQKVFILSGQKDNVVPFEN